MIRKFNYTGRKKIKRSNVQIDLLRNRNGHRQFNIALQLDELALPGNAHVYVEAYHRSGYQRFDFGTIANRIIPSDRTLRKRMKDNKTPGLFGFITRGGTYQEAKFESDADLIQSYYRNEGYVQAQVGQPELKVLETSRDGKTQWVQLVKA